MTVSSECLNLKGLLDKNADECQKPPQVIRKSPEKQIRSISSVNAESAHSLILQAKISDESDFNMLVFNCESHATFNPAR